MHDWKSAAKRYRESGRLWQAVAQHDFEVVRIGWAKGEPYTAEVRSGPLTILAAACSDLLDIGKADNYCALTMRDDIGELEVIVRRKQGKTPADVAGELRRENEMLRKCLGLEEKSDG